MGQYKAVAPKKTIQTIRAILTSLSLEIKETTLFIQNRNSCRTIIKNTELGCDVLKVGTNGKGMTPDYALASSYGEFMERLQNKALFRSALKFATVYAKSNPELDTFTSYLEKNNLLLEFRYLADEVQKTIPNREKFTALQQEFTPNAIDPNQNELVEKKFETLFAPFYSVFDRKQVELPYELMRASSGSTGLCAGNTPEEAILQGTCEIFERYVLQQLFLKGTVFPLINPDFFEGTTILKQLQKLHREEGIEFEIKDCSLDQKLPVVGLLLRNKHENSFSFRLGASSSPVYALERCFTEIYQGHKTTDSTLTRCSYSQAYSIKEEYRKCKTFGRGLYPSSLFQTGEYHEKPSYFDERRDLKSDTTDLHHIKDILRERNFQMYIRDNSFLGFPAYFVYIPGLSDTHYLLENLDAKFEVLNRYTVPSRWKVEQLSGEEQLKFADQLAGKDPIVTKLFSYLVGGIKTISNLVLAAALYFVNGQTGKAYGCISRYINENPDSVHSYYYCLRDYFIFYLEEINLTEIKTKLALVYENAVVQEVVNDFKEEKSVLEKLRMPQCFDCETCRRKYDCVFLSFVELEKKLQSIQKREVKDQNDLRMIFEKEYKQSPCLEGML